MAVDRTHDCGAVRDDEMDEIWRAVSDGTQILLKPHAQFPAVRAPTTEARSCGPLRRHVSSNLHRCLLERFAIDSGSPSSLIIRC